MLLTDAAVRELRRVLPGLELRENEPMSAHCSFRIGGPVRAMVLPSSPEELSEVLKLLGLLDLKPLVFGRCTNLLVTDAAIDRIAVKIDEGMSAIERVSETEIYAGAGAPLARAAQKAQALSLSGLEFAAGIPGSIGGAVSMNAGAYGSDMSSVLEYADCMNPDGEPERLSGDEMGLAYRRSAFTGSDRIITGALLRLQKGEPGEIAARMAELGEKRRSSQPLDIPSAGSTFKRPAGGYAAALIDSAGLKGFSIGGAQVSEKHAGFVVNRGGATFNEVLELMEHIRETVRRESGIELEPEVKIIRG